MDRWTAEMGRVREEKSREEERRSKKRKSQKKEDPDAPKGRKVAKHCVFPRICGPGGLKTRLAKVAGSEPCGQMRDEKLHAVVAQSTCPSQNVQSTPTSDHVWKLWCRKNARRCGAKHISKPGFTKHCSAGPLLEVDMSKKYEKVPPLWRKARFQVNMLKTQHVRTTFGRSDVVSRGTLCTVSKASKTWGLCSISKKRWQAWDIWRGSAKIHFPWQAQCKTHAHQRC